MIVMACKRLGEESITCSYPVGKPPPVDFWSATYGTGSILYPFLN